MLCKHKENKYGKDRTKANTSIRPENIPPFLRNRKLLKAQLEKEDPEHFKEILLKIRDIDKVSRIVSRCFTWVPQYRCLQIAELIPTAKNIVEVQATLQTQVLLGKMRLHNIKRYPNGKIVLENRILIKSQLPVLSVVL